VGNVHVGDTTYTYNIDNSGTTGPSLRGAIQNAANGGNITDGRLSGNGVLSSNWGPVAPGESTSRDITITIAGAGVYMPITGQAVSIVNNFENTRSQLLTISSSAGAAAYNLAAAAAVAPNPMNLGNQRVNGSATGALTITNTAPAGAFTEGLNASFGALSGNALSNGGSVNLLAGGASNSVAMTLGLDGTTAGAKSGTAQIILASDGSGSSGLGITALPTQIVNVSGNFYNRAVGSSVPSPVVIANQRVGGSGSQGLTVSNTAAPGAFTEALNASFGNTTGSATNNGGSVVDLIAGGSNNSALSVGVNTASAGAKSGNVTITYQTDGTGANGNSGLAAIGAGSQVINVSGNVYNTAIGATTPSPVVIANQRVGGTASQTLMVANIAAAGAFSEALNASFTGTTGTATSNGGSVSNLIAGGSNATAMNVGVNTSTAGAKSGSVTLAYQSDGTGPNGNSGLSAIAAGTQVVNVSGNVYQLAVGQLNTAPLNFGTVQVGQSVSQVLNVSNIAVGPSGFVEDLNVRFGASSGSGAAQISGTGSITALAAGASNGTALTVNVDTATAGTIDGAIAVNYFSAGSVNGVSNGLTETGVGSSGYAVNGVIQSQGQVINQALPVVNNASVDFGNLRIGSAGPSQFISVTNQASAPPQAALNASISGAGPISASGSFDLLDPGATNSSSLQVGVSTASAGAINGNASIAFVSDASNVGNCAPNCQLNLASQDVSVSAAIYRLANPQVTSGAISLAARVGDALPTASIGVTNASPDIYTERLNASIGAGPSGFSTSGSINGLAAGASSNNLGVSLNTTTAGNFSGQAALAFVSSGAGTTGAPDQALASQNVSLSGTVYTPAIVQVNTPVVDFGIVHVGDSVSARNVSVTNAAAVAAPNDTLGGSLGGASGPFTASGTLAGLNAQDTDAASLNVVLNTANAGAFNGSANASFVSQNGQLSDLALGDSTVSLQAQVNNYAELSLSKTGGAGSFSFSAGAYTLEFGSLVQGSTSLDATLALFNSASGPADLLSGSFATGAGSAFTLSGFGPFVNLAAGEQQGGLNIGFESSALGDFTRTIVISSVGSNASGFQGALADTTLVLHGSVVAVPEPSTYMLMAGGLLAVWLARRRQTHVARG